jgi:hypothetical protein
MNKDVGTIPKQIKSKKRVRDLAEVYTRNSEIDAMLDSIPLKTPEQILTYTYFEPACGNGNFLLAILKRKLAFLHENISHEKPQNLEVQLLKLTSTIYGIDICHENVNESRRRMRLEIFQFCKSNFREHKLTTRFYDSVNKIIKMNIQQGDTLLDEETLLIYEFVFDEKSVLVRTFTLAELQLESPKPINESSNISIAEFKGVPGHFTTQEEQMELF